MSANVGDRIRLHANSIDTPDRTGTVVAVLGHEDGPPYRVRFDSGEETILTPGPDATIEPPTLSERVDQVTQRVSEKADEVRETARESAQNARETAEKATGRAARSVAEAAEKIADRFER